VILATDPDREGEAIAYHVKHVISSKEKFRPKVGQPLAEKIKNGKFKRIVFHEITESAIKHALESHRDIDMQLVDAQQARRVLDRLVGYKLSPLLWRKIGMRWLSAGRVQSVAVRLIVEREREIEAFKPQEYWLIEVELIPQDHPREGEDLNQSEDSRLRGNDRPSFFARLVQIDDKKAEIKNKTEAEKIVEDLKVSAYKILNIEIKELKKYPVPPFTTSTLQQNASNRFGWSAKKVMRAAQILYEEGYITYHRTDSTNLASEAISMARDYINKVYGISYLPPAPKYYKTKSKVAQEAHEAIRPTDVKVKSEEFRPKADQPLAEKVKSEVGRDASMLYELIWKRFLACQMNEAIVEQTNVEILAKHVILNEVKNPVRHSESAADPQAIPQDDRLYLLKAQGERMKFDGWLILYGGNNLEKELPPLSLNEKLDFINVLPQQKFTEPPARFTEATLIKALEEKGIGRPSTYAPIISTIQDRKYVEKLEKKFHPTDLGKTVNDFLVKYFPDVFDIGFTAHMEDELDEIANGKMNWNNVVGDFYSPFNNKLEEVSKTAERVKVDLGTTDEKCPQCGNQLVIRLSKYGRFLACSIYPACKYTKNLVEKIDLPCPRCQGDIVVKRTRRGKQFYGCVNWPKCTFAAWKKEDIK